jgi:lipase
VQLNAYTWGEESGRPVVCLHGVTGHGRRFRRLAEERLADNRVLGLDLRGHGHSGWEPPWDAETHVDDLLETADALGIARACWVGHSFGGRLVAELVARAPERVERAILLDPAMLVDPATSLAQAEGLRADTSFATPQEAIDAKVATGTYVSTPPETWEEEAEQHLEQGDDGRYRWRFSPLAAICAWSEMSRRGAPVPLRDVLVVVGAQSWLPVALPRIATIRVEKVPGGHSVLFDDFDATADAIAAFLAE